MHFPLYLTYYSHCFLCLFLKKNCTLLSMRLQSEEPHSCLEFYYTESCLGNIHPSIHFLNCASRLPVIGGEAGYNLDRLLVYHRSNTAKKELNVHVFRQWGEAITGINLV